MKRAFFERIAILSLLLLVGLDGAIWYQILKGQASRPSLSFLDVGQGDATLLELPRGVGILTDTGPDRKILESLRKATPRRNYLDLVIITHPQADHMQGLLFLLESYDVGAVAVNGALNTDFSGAKAIVDAVRQKRIPLLVLREGDRIRYEDTAIDILWPSGEFLESAEANDTGIVEYITTQDFRALLTADIGENIEAILLKEYDLAADILKVGHHGSKYSSSEAFLNEVHPRIALIGVGERNRYGHPTKDALGRLAAIGATVARTDEEGTLTIAKHDNFFAISTQKP